MNWNPSHRVPESGLPAWTEPDPTSAPAAQLDPRLDVEVIDEFGGWTQIRCSNGWEAWIDGTQLEPQVTQPSESPVTPLPSDRTAMSPIEPFDWAMNGLALALVLTFFLAWFSASGQDQSAFTVANNARDALSDLSGRSRVTALALQAVYPAALAAVTAAGLRAVRRPEARWAGWAAAGLSMIAALALLTDGELERTVLGTGFWANLVVAVSLALAGIIELRERAVER